MNYDTPIKTIPTTPRELVVLTLAFLIRQGRPSAVMDAATGVQCAIADGV
jgi:hypothetical protein